MSANELHKPILLAGIPHVMRKFSQTSKKLFESLY